MRKVVVACKPGVNIKASSKKLRQPHKKQRQVL